MDLDEERRSLVQQGNKLAGTGAHSVSLSADGNTAIAGIGFGTGGAWIWTRTGGVWSQQGSKLVGSGAIGSAAQGTSVSLSGDGNTAVVGGSTDDGAAGATWVWTRSGGVWTQQATKLVGSGAAGNAAQGVSVSLSADGNTAMVGGFSDNNSIGAAWVFFRSSVADPSSIPAASAWMLLALAVVLTVLGALRTRA